MLINDPFCDPGLFISFLHQRRALLFDLGDLHALTPRDLMKVSHVFVTHAHMDHFIGFDLLLRTLLGRDKEIHLFGPPEFLNRVEGKLAGYTWNLVEEYEHSVCLTVTEVWPEKLKTKRFFCRDQFRPVDSHENAWFQGVLLKEPSFRLEASLLDHRVPCLGLALIENFSINIDTESLRNMDLPVGPWLTRFKRALYGGAKHGDGFVVTWEDRGRTVKEERFVLDELAEKIARISPGQKIAYISDVVGRPENLEKAESLIKHSDHLFIEAPFMDRDRAIAEKKCHLTAKQAGTLAKKAGVKRLTVFHFSPRYAGMGQELEREAMEAFNEKD
ncbi:MAG: ribonuclease Z [Deltaproteobacteria bacterium]|nr:ribonuclease Z [Deltaproteobacteria bacterium]